MGLFKQKFNPVSSSFNLIPTGTIITFKDGVANAASLPGSGNALNDARITSDTGHLYIWDGSTWIDSGDIIDLKWSAIDGKPTSSVSSIDNAVSNSHAPHSDDQIIPDQLSDLSDDTTHRLVTDVEKLYWNDKVENSDLTDAVLNIMLNAFRIAQIGSLTIFAMVKGFVDEYEDESGVDLGESLNQSYDSVDDFYEPAITYGGIDEFTKLTIHANGDDESTTIIDEMGYTVTAVGDTQLDTDIKKFGTASIQLNEGKSGGSATDYASINMTTDADLGTGDFTIDLWTYIKEQGQYGNTPFITHDWNYWNTGLGGVSWGLYFAPVVNTGKLWFIRKYGSTDPTIEGRHTTTDITLNLNTWYHLAVVRTGNNLKFFVDGVQQGTDVDCSGINYDRINTSLPVYIGRLSGGGVGEIPLNFIGRIDEVRISKGIARWTSDFTLPIGEYSGASTIPNILLQSNTQVAVDVPTSARIVIFEEDVDSITLNTDLKAYISRDNGTTFSQVTLEDEGNYITGARILSGLVDVSSQPSGTNMIYKLVTDNNKNLKIHGTAISWK